jgi:hypothetical protein
VRERSSGTSVPPSREKRSPRKHEEHEEEHTKKKPVSSNPRRLFFFVASGFVRRLAAHDPDAASLGWLRRAGRTSAFVIFVTFVVSSLLVS